MYDSVLVKNDIKLSTAIETLKYKYDIRRNDPTFFDADGLIVFTGAQGSGKTLSAVNYVKALMDFYPQAKLVTNIMIKDYPAVSLDEWISQFYGFEACYHLKDFSELAQYKVIQDYLYLNRVFPFQNNDDLLRFHNGTEGIIYLIDEIQLYFNSLESKNVSMEIMTEISQQRKQRKHIVCTSQVFGRLAKPLREQFNTVVECRNYFNLLQVNFFIKQEDIENTDDMKPKGKISQRQIFIHSRELYESYDTYYKIKNAKFADFEKGNREIYDRYTIELG